jgi:hypothetical protein
MRVRQTTAVSRPQRRAMGTVTLQNERGAIPLVIQKYPRLEEEQLANLAGFARLNAIN